MKRTLAWILFALPLFALGQFRLSDGQYLRMEAGGVGVHTLTGQQLMDWGLLSQGDSAARFRVLTRPEGALGHSNAIAQFNNIHPQPYYVVDSDELLDANTRYYFYVHPVGDFWREDSLYRHLEQPYSFKEFFLVSAEDHNQSGVFDQKLTQPIPSARTVETYLQVLTVDTAQYNLVGTGRRWFGPLFDFTTARTYAFSEPAVPGTPISAQINAVARSNTSATQVELAHGGQSAAEAFPSVGTSSVSAFVTERGFTANFTAENAVNEIVVRYVKTVDPSAAMWLDNLRVNYFVSNAYAPQKRLQNFARGAGQQSKLTLSGAPSDVLIFEVHPENVAQARFQRILPQTEAGQLVWGSEEDVQRDYVVVHPAAALSPTRVATRADANWAGQPHWKPFESVQNIIVAPDFLMPYAEELAQLHTDQGLTSKAVDLQEIYDVYNAGTPDIAALRLFLYTVKHFGGELSYLTLFGDASYDYRGVLPGTSSNLVPTFQSYGSFSLYASFITDDYFGYLDDGEGTNWYTESLDLGIGRLPVVDTAEARAAVDKIRRYLEGAERFGPWRTRSILVADDVDESWEREFAEVMDDLAKEFDTTRSELNQIKIYSDAFQQESKPGSQRYPEAREKLFREVEQGALMVSFVGHGGEVGWTTERILQLEDVNNWSNANASPVFTTITCEFTRFDDPNRVSAGEQLFLNPDGGAIALFSTTRSVFATTSTYQLNQLLNRNMMQLENPRLGDVIRITKNNNNSGDKIKFSLIGDPALPLARPEWRVVFDSINGQPWANFTDTLAALSWVQISGSVRPAAGTPPDANFNGTAWVEVFDKAQQQQTRVNDGAGAAYNFTTQNNAVFKGRATVRSGTFTLAFRVPQDINWAVGSARVGAYATDGSKDAWGSDRQLQIGGLYDGPITDNQGPEVRLFLDDTTFTYGGISHPDPDALGLLQDESGINAVGLGIGHNITLILDGKSINVNDYYTADQDDFTRGTVRYPFFDLAEGEHFLELRAWDVLNQWGYDSLRFTVVGTEVPLLEQLVAFPNPFVDQVNFSLNHNQAGESGTLRIEVLNNQGQVIWHRAEPMTFEGAQTQLPVFRLSENPGGAPGAGFYHARVKWTRASDGKSATIQEKLIYIR